MKKILTKFNINLPALPIAPPHHLPDKATLLLLAGVIGIAVIAHFSIASMMIGVFALCVFLLKCVVIWRGAKSPSQWLMLALTIISLVMIIHSYGGWSGQKPGISFLVLLVTMKFLESKSVRDYFVVCLILYFLTASSFLFNASIPGILLVIAYTIAITGLLFKLNNPAPVNTLTVFKASTVLMTKAIPLALFLFFFFPRIDGDFGFLPSLDKSSNSLEDSLVAGDLSTKAFDDNLVFIAHFADGIPPMHRLYWRAKVMEEEINFAWQISRPNQYSSANRKVAQQMHLAAQKESQGTRYSIIHEPTFDTSLPYLDYVENYDKGRINHDYTVKIPIKERNSLTYSGVSSLIPTFDNTGLPLEPLTTTESNPTARIQALLTSIRQNHSTELDRANAVYDYFKKNEFNYSLEPPELDEINPLDNFLFGTKTGYCEHYASAFTTLLRWLDIPSRVVVGYHGGRVNNRGNFIEVSYADAHAWSEAYIDNTWVRFDATGALSPERIEFGMEALREMWDNDQFGNDNAKALSDFLNPTGSALLWKKINENWSNLQYQWKKWVIDYDFETQKELLSKIGLNTKNSLYTLLIILSVGVLLMLLFYFWQLLPKSQNHTELQKAYYRFLKKVQRSGINAELCDTPNEITAKIQQHHPELKTQVANIADLYNDLSYGQSKEASKINKLNTLIRNLKIKKIQTI